MCEDVMETNKPLVGADETECIAAEQATQDNVPDNEVPISEEKELLDQMLALREMVLGNNKNVESLVFAVKFKGNNSPAVVFHGEQLEYTALAVAVARTMRNRVMQRIDS